MATTPGLYRRYTVTDLLLREAEEPDWPFLRRLRRTVTQLDRLRQSRLELIAIDAALDEARDAVSHQGDQFLTVSLEEIDDIVESQSQLLASGIAIELPWAALDDIRSRAGLQPAIKPRKR
jgi:hypothetical protein